MIEGGFLREEEVNGEGEEDGGGEVKERTRRIRWCVWAGGGAVRKGDELEARSAAVQDRAGAASNSGVQDGLWGKKRGSEGSKEPTQASLCYWEGIGNSNPELDLTTVVLSFCTTKGIHTDTTRTKMI